MIHAYTYPPMCYFSIIHHSLGNVSVSYCKELHNVTSNVTEVSSTGTVCFQCLGPDPVVVWSINDSQTVTSSIGATTPEGVLVVFLAAPVFSVDSPTSLRCFSLEVLIAETFVTLQGEEYLSEISVFLLNIMGEVVLVISL